LRNALGPVRNANQILDRPDAREDDLRAARAMLDRQVTHMTRLIDDLLDVSRIAQGKILLRKELFDIGALVRTVAADHRSLLEAGDLRLELSLPGEPIWTAGDPVRISQVVGNLLQNAAKFTDPGGRVTVSAETAGDSVLVEIRDTGIGMSPEVAASAFDFFSQSESSRDRSRGGLGLGLALARGLVELHGGHLRAESEGPGLGSRFTVRLPLDRRADATSPRGHRSGLRRAALRILIVEDNQDMAESLGILLRLDGHRVETARTGAAGVELAQKLRPDVVLCDLGLPGGMDGYSVAARLRADPTTCRTHLVALSGYADEDARSRAAKAGFDQHLSKPVSLETIDEVLAHVVPN
jgi:CheY-like chemotaxis protein/two-component sensor histidine kinase